MQTVCYGWLGDRESRGLERVWGGGTPIWGILTSSWSSTLTAGFQFEFWKSRGLNWRQTNYLSNHLKIYFKSSYVDRGFSNLENLYLSGSLTSFASHLWGVVSNAGDSSGKTYTLTKQERGSDPAHVTLGRHLSLSYGDSAIPTLYFLEG